MKRIYSSFTAFLILIMVCGCVDQTEDVFLPDYLIRNALRKEIDELENDLNLSFSKENFDERTGGYLFNCEIQFGERTATQIEFQFWHNKLSTILYRFPNLNQPEDAYCFIKELAAKAKEKHPSAMLDTYGRDSTFIKYPDYREFEIAAEASWKELPLPAEAIDLYSLDERTQVEYNFTLYESGLFFSSVRYAAVIERSIDAEAHFK